MEADKKIPKLLILLILLINLPAGAMAAEHGVIVQYHHVDTGTPPSTTISPDDFRRHLQYLHDNGFHVMALDDMLAALRNREQIPDRSIAITFDDGYLSIYENAFPLLVEFGFPFTLFVSTQPIDDNQPGFMDWDQINEMVASGALIANHMVDHPYMLEPIAGESDADRIQRLRENLLAAEQRIAANTGQSHRILAYPYGEYDPAIRRMLEEEGFLGVAQNSGAVGFHSDFLAIPRYPLAGVYARLETARDKFASLAFRVGGRNPENPVTNSDSPAVQLEFLPGDYRFEQISCFADGNPINTTWLNQEQGLLSLQPEQAFTARRWRYICTAPQPGSNRYFWYSVQWINPARGE